MAEETPRTRAPRTSSLRSAGPSTSSHAPEPLCPVPGPSSTTASPLLQPRKNRNKKALTLGAATSKPGTLSGTDVAELLQASSGDGGSVSRSATLKRGPAPIQVAPRLGIRTMNSTPVLDSTPLLPSTPSLSSSSTASSALSSALASLDLELGVEFNLDLRNEDLLVLNELGAGNGGTVERVKHVPTGFIMAKKVSSMSVRMQSESRV